MIKSLQHPDTLALELAQASRIIDQFIKSCSHDLRGPLASIQGLVDVARRSEGDDLSQCLDLILRCNSKLMEMIGSLEGYMIHSRKEIKPETIDPEQMAAGVLDQYKHLIAAHKIQVKLTVDQPFPWVSDPESCTMILREIVSNAIRFADDSKSRKKILISIQCSAEAVTMAVQDNGIGMTEEHKKLLYEPFFRGARQSRTGLGLFLVRTLIDKLGGSMSILSQEEEGTTCRLTIPNLILL
jgi:signal transduction histidine kinase